MRWRYSRQHGVTANNHVQQQANRQSMVSQEVGVTWLSSDYKISHIQHKYIHMRYKMQKNEHSEEWRQQKKCAAIQDQEIETL